MTKITANTTLAELNSTLAKEGLRVRSLSNPLPGEWRAELAGGVRGTAAYLGFGVSMEEALTEALAQKEREDFVRAARNHA